MHEIAQYLAVVILMVGIALIATYYNTRNR